MKRKWHESNENSNGTDDESDPFKTRTEGRGESQTVTKSEEISYASKFKLYKQGYNEEAVTGSLINVEIALIGAGIGGGFTNTQELHVMK